MYFIILYEGYVKSDSNYAPPTPSTRLSTLPFVLSSICFVLISGLINNMVFDLPNKKIRILRFCFAFLNGQFHHLC